MDKKEHVCVYTEKYRSINEFEPSLTNLGMECNCGSFLFCTSSTEKINQVPVGEYSFKGESEAERKESIKKSNAIRNKVRARLGMSPLGDDGFPVDSTLEERDKNFKNLLKALNGGR